MILRVLGHGFHYEGENLCRVFFPHEKITVTKNGEGEDPLTVITFMSEENGKADIEVSVVSDGEKSERKCTAVRKHESDEEWRALCEKKMMTELFYLLSEYTGYTPKWGILTGVRPSKLMNKPYKHHGRRQSKRIF